MTATTTRADRRAERALLTRARRGDTEALRGLLHRHASVVWAACALVSDDEKQAAERFGDCWDRILESLGGLHRSPGIAGMLLGECRGLLAESVPEARVENAIASATHLAMDEQDTIEVPPAALISIAGRLEAHASRLAEGTAQRRGARRQKVILPSAILGAVVVGLLVAQYAASRPSSGDLVARCIRLRIVESDLVPRFRDCVSPPFAVEERPAAEVRQFEQIGLVLEELSNAPVKLKRTHVAHLGRRVRGLDLVDFAWERSEKATAGDREVLEQVVLVLEEIANL